MFRFALSKPTPKASVFSSMKNYEWGQYPLYLKRRNDEISFLSINFLSWNIISSQFCPYGKGQNEKHIKELKHLAGPFKTDVEEYKVTVFANSGETRDLLVLKNYKG